MQLFIFRSLFIFTCILAPFWQTALAHENQLSGLVYMQPQTPIPEEPFKVTLELIDPEGAYIPEAIVKLSIPNLEFEKQFTETNQVGIYTMELALPDGKWLTNITETTFEDESNTVQFGLNIGKENREIIELLFPVMEETRQFPNFTVYLSLIIIVLIALVAYIFRFRKFKSYSLGSIASLSRASTPNTHS